MINIEAHINYKFDGQGTTFDGCQNQSNKKKNDKRIRFQPRHTKKRKSHILGQILWLWKNVIFTSHGCSYLHFLENDLAEVKRTKNNSNGAIVYDDDAHIVVLCTRSHFLSKRWVLLSSKEKTLKI